MKKTILLDVDEVLADTINPLLSIYNKKHHLAIKKQDLKTYALHKNKGIEKDVYDIFYKPSFFRYLEVDKTAQLLVPKLQDLGYDIVFATAILPPGYKDRHDWLLEHFPSVPYENFMFGTRKDLLKADFILDDHLENLINSPCLHRFLMDRPWNQLTPPIEKYHGIKRVTSFEMFFNQIIASQDKLVV